MKTFQILTRIPSLSLAKLLLESGLSPFFPAAIGACKVLHFKCYMQDEISLAKVVVRVGDTWDG